MTTLFEIHDSNYDSLNIKNYMIGNILLNEVNILINSTEKQKILLYREWINENSYKYNNIVKNIIFTGIVSIYIMKYSKITMIIDFKNDLFPTEITTLEINNLNIDDLECIKKFITKHC
jgi:hypothetical protein